MEQITTREKYRMHFLVMYNISPIQQGIQALHAVVEYALKYSNDEDYQEWARFAKTVILLNGGTSNIQGWNLYEGIQEIGGMESALKQLVEAGVKCAAFNEPDLNNATSAICWLMPEQAWNRTSFPDAAITVVHTLYFENAEDAVAFKAGVQYKANVEKYGERIAFLRQFNSQFRLA